MRFEIGDRVRMLRHGDWKTDATGTVISPGRVRGAVGTDGRPDVWYWIEFDEPQRDLTDELRGDLDRRYDSATVVEAYLRPLG